MAGATTARGAHPDVVLSIRRLGKMYTPTPRWMRMLVRTVITEPVVALQDVDLELRAGQVCAVVGPNGAGKTTMFRIVVGLTTPTTGTAMVAGHDAHHESTAVRRQLGWMPAEDRSLFLRLTCWENLYAHGRLHGIARPELEGRIRDLLAQVGLGRWAATSVFALSAGMRARLQLARALLTRPRLLILDEPTASVDPVGAHELLELIVGLVEEDGMAALISSHRLEEIESLHSQVVLLDRGSVRFQGDLDELRARYDRPRLDIEFADEVTAQRAATLLTPFAEVTMASSRLSCLPAQGFSTGEVLHGLGSLLSSVIRVHERPLPLRDVLVGIYTGSDARAEAPL